MCRNYLCVGVSIDIKKFNLRIALFYNYITLKRTACFPQNMGFRPISANDENMEFSIINSLVYVRHCVCVCVFAGGGGERETLASYKMNSYIFYAIS